MWYNPIMAWLLRSPLHGLVSGSMMVIAYTGRKSGKTYQTPVNFLPDGDLLYTTSFRQRTWWRNLRGGAPVKVWLHGRARTGLSTVYETEGEVAQALARVIQLKPMYARFLQVNLDAHGQPEAGDILAAAAGRVVIETRLG